MLVEAGSGHTAGPLGMADIFTLFYLSEKGMQKEYEQTSNLLERRDQLMQDKEFINILGAFSFENLSLESERPIE